MNDVGGLIGSFVAQVLGETPSETRYASKALVGSRGRTRTYNITVNSRVLYH